MIKNYFENRYDINAFIQRSEYMIDSDMFLVDEGHRLHNRGRKLNKKRIFVNPSCTVRDEKVNIINYDES